MIKNKYTFTCERVDEENYTEESCIEVRHNDLTYLPNIVIAFEEFLRGAGFYFEGHLEFVNDKEEE